MATVTFLIALAQLPIANVSAVLQALPLAVTMGAALDLWRDGRLAPLAGDRRGLCRRRASSCGPGLRRLQRLFADGAHLRRLLRRARPCHQRIPGRDPDPADFHSDRARGYPSAVRS